MKKHVIEYPGNSSKTPFKLEPGNQKSITYYNAVLTLEITVSNTSDEIQLHRGHHKDDHTFTIVAGEVLAEAI